MALLNTYQDAEFALSLRRLFSSYYGPLVRVIRESDLVEVDVLPDSNGEISYDSSLSRPEGTLAYTLGQFLNIDGYTDADSLGSVYEGRLITIYDQSVGANHVSYDTFSNAFIFVEHSLPAIFPNSTGIIKVSGVPSFFAVGTSKTFTPYTLLGTEYSLHFLSGQVGANPIGFRVLGIDANGLSTSPYDIFLYTNLATTVFQPSGSTDVFNVNNVYINTEQCDETQNNVFAKPNGQNEDTVINSIEFAFFDNATTQANFSAAVDGPSFYIVANSFYADIIVYEGYDNIRRLFIEDLYSNAVNNVETKVALSTFSFEEENVQDNSFIAQFGTPAAAYSVRSLRGLTGLNGPKVLRVRREVDNAEVDVYTDNSGWVSLDSPVVIVPAITGQIDGGTGVEIESLASTLGEFVADADHDDVDSLGSPTTAKVVVWYDQSSADYTIISEEIDARGAPVRIRVVGGTYDAYEFDLYFDDNESISLSSYVADTYEISDGATQVTANLTLGTLQTLVDAGMTEATVCVWYDQSGNANDATQTTAANQPKIYDSSTGVVTENGKPAVQFDGTNDSLNAGAVDVPTMTISVLGSYNTTSDNSRPFAVKGAVTSAKDTFAQATDFSLRYDGTFSAGTLTPSTGTQYLRFSQRSTSAQTDYVNTSSNVNDTQTLPNIEGTYSIGNAHTSGNYFDGKVQEAIAWESDQSANRTGIESNINDYYDIYGTGNTGVNTPLLDTYSDAAAAYSLRKLRTSYNGPVNLSKRKDAIQNVATAQPKIYDSSAGIVIENGKPALSFTNTSMTFQTEITTNPIGLFALHQDTASGTAQFPLYKDTNNRLWEHTTYGQQRLRIGGKTAIGVYSSTNDVKLWSLIQYTDGTNAQTLIDGTAISNYSSGYTITTQQGAFTQLGFSYTGDAQEIIIYSADKSADRTDIENNINSAFQIYAANFSSVLDSVPLAKAAYSIRRLTKNYIDPIITVTNGSTTKDFYADFWGNLDVDALTSFANGGTLSITKWWDQSGEGVHLLTTSTRPTLSIANNEVSIDTTNKFYEPLLDRYEGAAAAYSLRILKGDYTGPLVRVRRDGTNTEVDVYPDENLTISLNSPVLNVAEATTDVTASPEDTLANTLGEFVADAGNDPDGLGAPVSAFVVVWYDQANSNNASQDISTAQPKIYDSVNGVVTENGKPAVLFDGVDDGYLTPLASSDPSTYFITCDNNGNSGKTPASPMQVNSFYIDNRTALRVRVNGTEFTTATQTAADFQIQYILHNTTASEAAVNGAVVTSGTVGAVNGSVVSIGQAPLGGKWLGNIFELIIYQSDQSSNRTGIETNINNHYQIPNFNATASTAQTVAVYNNAINTTVDLNATYTDLKEIIKYE